MTNVNFYLSIRLMENYISILSFVNSHYTDGVSPMTQLRSVEMLTEEN